MKTITKPLTDLLLYHGSLVQVEALLLQLPLELMVLSTALYLGCKGSTPLVHPAVLIPSILI